MKIQNSPPGFLTTQALVTGKVATPLEMEKYLTTVASQDPNIIQANPAVKMAGFVGRVIWPNDKEFAQLVGPIAFFHAECLFGQNFPAAPTVV